MVADDLPRALDQLAFLGRSRNVSVRPVLLPVMVDMFLHKPHHTEGEIRQFEELILNLVEDADGRARLAAAEKLSRHSQTPPALLARMARLQIMAAHKASGDGRDDDPLRIAMLGSVEAALALAARPDLDVNTIRSLTERPEMEVLYVLVDNPAIALEPLVLRSMARRAADEPTLVEKLLNRLGTQAESAALFLAAAPAQRAQLIVEARRRDLGGIGQALPPASAEALAVIERASYRHGCDGLDVALAASLGLGRDEVEVILDDRHGEPLALALAAIGVAPESAARLFILGTPVIGHSYRKVRALVAIVQTVPPRAAASLVFAMLGRTIEQRRRGMAPGPVADPPLRRAATPALRAESAPAGVQVARMARGGG